MKTPDKSMGCVVTSITPQVDGKLERQYMVHVTGVCIGRIGLELGLKMAVSFRQLFVNPSCRMHGVGTLLVGLCVKEALERGNNAINCEIDGDNVSVLKFYNSLGFMVAAQFDDGSMIVALELPSERAFELVAAVDNWKADQLGLSENCKDALVSAAQPVTAWTVQFEFPPMRAIYQTTVDGSTEEEALKNFHEANPRGKVRKIEPADETPY